MLGHQLIYGETLLLISSGNSAGFRLVDSLSYCSKRHKCLNYIQCVCSLCVSFCLCQFVCFLSLTPFLLSCFKFLSLSYLISTCSPVCCFTQFCIFSSFLILFCCGCSLSFCSVSQLLWCFAFWSATC